jgi:Ran GTPase-activating protein (RanGAP) involved in mRNA processing and transport
LAGTISTTPPCRCGNDVLLAKCSSTNARAFQSILDGVIRNDQLQGLNIEWNVMRGSKVYQTASRVLRFNTTLRSLDLKHCGMSLEGAYVLAKGLSCNSTIQNLVLDGNPIGQNGARQIMVSASAAMHNPQEQHYH